MTAFHAAVKSGQILLRTSQKKEENEFKGVKRLSLCITIRAFSILLLWLWWQELINSAIFTKYYFPKIEAIQEETLARVKVAFRQKNYKYFNK